MAATDQPQRGAVNRDLLRDLFRDREAVDVGLRLLDHQIVGEKDQLLGNVDNLEVRETSEGLVVTSLAVGPGALGPRLPGRLGRWMVAVWRRLSPEDDPEPMLLPLAEVRSVGSTVGVTDRAATSLASGAGVELWLREHLVGRIPGAREGEDRLAGEPLGEEAPTSGRHPEGRWMSELIGASVRDASGATLGRVLDVGCAAFERTDDALGRLRVVDLLVGRRTVGAELGYVEEGHTGPWLIGRLVDRLHRDDRRVSAAAVASIDWDARVVTVSGDATRAGQPAE
jgi:sporulation protein YlmC with PRC-barrel domain